MLLLWWLWAKNYGSFISNSSHSYTTMETFCFLCRFAHGGGISTASNFEMVESHYQTASSIQSSPYDCHVGVLEEKKCNKIWKVFHWMGLFVNVNKHSICFADRDFQECMFLKIGWTWLICYNNRDLSYISILWCRVIQRRGELNATQIGFAEGIQDKVHMHSALECSRGFGLCWG